MSEEVTSDMGPKCPYCGYVHSDAEDFQYGWFVQYECGNCKRMFRVRKKLSRTWESIRFA